MPDEPTSAALPNDASDTIAGEAAVSHNAGRGAAAGVTGDNANAGEWPDDLPANRETGREGGAVAPPTSPQPKQAPMDDAAGGPTADAAAEDDDAAKLGDFA